MRQLVWMIALCAAAGCGKKTRQAPESTGSGEATPSTTLAEIDPAARAEAQQMFNTVCSTCHGKDGRGDGPGAAALNPKPRNYTDKAWQASVTDEQIKNTILMGGAAVGKSPAMPAQPQLREKPQVVSALVAIVRSFGNAPQAQPDTTPNQPQGSGQPAPPAQAPAQPH